MVERTAHGAACVSEISVREAEIPTYDSLAEQFNVILHALLLRTRIRVDVTKSTFPKSYKLHEVSGLKRRKDTASQQTHR